MQTFSIDGQAMHYLDIGQGDVLVFGHSYLWDGDMWRSHLAELSQHYRCIVPDFWGHGQSAPAPASMTSLDDYAQHILLLMDHLNIEQVSLIGMSSGGMWASALTSLAPERITALVLINSFVGLEPEVMHAKYFAMLNTIIAQQAIPSELAEQIVSMFFSHNSVDAALPAVAHFRQHLAAYRGERALEIAKIGKMLCDRRDQFDLVEQWALPVLILTAAEDTVRTVLESYLMHDAITGSEMVTIPAAGHMSALEQPQLVTQYLQQFFANVYQV